MKNLEVRTQRQSKQFSITDLELLQVDLNNPWHFLGDLFEKPIPITRASKQFKSLNIQGSSDQQTETLSIFDFFDREREREFGRENEAQMD